MAAKTKATDLDGCGPSIMDDILSTLELQSLLENWWRRSTRPQLLTLVSV
ncbi:hypothetical protein [Adonisia turfae]|nr:hypothetical protein [Adonisia turfae]